MCYDLKKRELGQIERIAEFLLRNVLKTTKGCPTITQMYLEVGQYSVSFEIQKIRVLVLKTSNDDTNLKTFFNLQMK